VAPPPPPPPTLSLRARTLGLPTCTPLPDEMEAVGPAHEPAHDGVAAVAGAYAGVRHTGTVTSFSSQTAWGFISCPDLAAVLGKDVFFHLKDCTGASITKGQTVTFVLEDNHGKPQAREVQGQQASPDPEGAIRYTGIVTSFSLQSAWGFISCPDLTPVYGKDIFFHIKDCGGALMQKEQQVSFLLDENSAPGKPRARSVFVLGPQVLGGTVPESGGGYIDPVSGTTRYRGIVTNHSVNTAWGFIDCQELKAVYGKDVFFHNKDCVGQPATKGAVVNFALVLDERGDPSKPRASQIVVEQAGIQPPQPQQPLYQEGYQTAYQQLANSLYAPQQQTLYDGQPQQQMLPYAGSSLQPELQGLQGREGDLVGSIQSFSAQAGWGFIECAALNLAGGRGLFFHAKDCEGMVTNPPTKGAHVAFQMGTGPSGKPQAVHVRYLAEQPAPAAGVKRTAAAVSAVEIDAAQMLALQQLQMQILGGELDRPAKRQR